MSIMSTVVAQLIGQSPLLLVYMIGIVVALAYWSRYRGPASLMLIASASLLAVTIGQTILGQYVIQSRADMGWDTAKLGFILSAVALTSSLIRAAAMGLMLAAVFMGRTTNPGERRSMT